MTLLEVRGAPNYYACDKGVLAKLPSFLANNSLKNPLIIHGEKSWNVARPFFPESSTATFERYLGECSLEEIERIGKLASIGNHDVVIGIGGGKVLDITKAVGNDTVLPVILVPTLAATCAAWTPLSVIYDQSGRFLHYTIFRQSALAVFVEPSFFVSSPVPFLRAGIGDTLAKWYEADVMIRQEQCPTVAVQIAHQAAKLCQANLLSNSLTAIKDLQNNELSPELISVIETNIMAGGMVGGFGDRFGRISGAHSIHNGLTHVPETHHLLHGEKVAFGILVQLMLEENIEEIKRLLPFYQDLKLPISLTSLGITDNFQEAAATVAIQSTQSNESIHLIGHQVTAAEVQRAILELDKLTSAY